MKAVPLVGCNVELVRPFDEIEAIDLEDDLPVPRHRGRLHLFDVSVRTIAADTLRVEDADAEHKIVDGLWRTDLHPDPEPITGVIDVGRSLVPLQRDLGDSDRA